MTLPVDFDLDWLGEAASLEQEPAAGQLGGQRVVELCDHPQFSAHRRMAVQLGDSRRNHSQATSGLFHKAFYTEFVVCSL